MVENKQCLVGADLIFKLDVDDHDKPIYDEDGWLIDYEFHKIEAKGDMKLGEVDKIYLNKELKMIDKKREDVGGNIIDKRIAIYKGDEYIGEIMCNFSARIRSKEDFIYEAEILSGCAGVVACEVVSRKLYTKLVRNKGFAYIHYIRLNDGYDDLENESIVLRKLMSFIKENYGMERVFARPEAYDLNEDEYKCMRILNKDIEELFYLEYPFVVGYVESYYKDVPEYYKYFYSMSEDQIKAIRDSYESKKKIVQDVYRRHGFELIGMEVSRVMCAEI